MGVKELFHFRRILFRRGRRVADGSRQFVVGFNKDDDSKSECPNGRHFDVGYEGLTSEELDACNNNDGQTSPAGTRSPSSSNTGSSIVSSVIPRGESTICLSSPEVDNGIAAAAVIATTELEEVHLFRGRSQSQVNINNENDTGNEHNRDKDGSEDPFSQINIATSNN